MTNKTESSKNTDLWNTLFQTDKAAVKPITGKDYSGNSPKPYYLIQKATEVFGPCGIGWGFRVVDQGTVSIKNIENVGNDRNPNYVEVLRVNHWALVEFWYKWDGEKSEPIQQFGGTTLAYNTKAGKQKFDEDAQKKSVTDALIKCMSCIGFAGDIFSGRWDDSKYHEETRIAQEQQEYEAQKAAQEEERRQYNEALTEDLRQIQNAENTDILRAIAQRWHETQSRDVIIRAIKAKSDLEGWSKDKGADNA